MNYLICGLGNIGTEYENTRHNIGFSVLDFWARSENFTFRTDRLAEVAEIKFRGHKLTLIKPSTYMNLSGKAVNYWLQMQKIARENLLVIVDDLALPFGKIRIRNNGSAGGHNGLKDIEAVLTTSAYCRLRFGIGSTFTEGKQVNYVLGKWTPEEEKELPALQTVMIDAVKSFVIAGIERTMNQYNKK